MFLMEPEYPVFAGQRRSRYQFEIFQDENTSLSLVDPFLPLRLFASKRPLSREEPSFTEYGSL